MSLQQFQAALAYVIRLPETNTRKDMTQLLADYDLSPDEQSLLMRMSEHRLVKAYGLDMIDARWRIISRVVNCLYTLVPRERFMQICREGFEPQHAEVNFLDVNTKFLEYLITDAHARDFITKDAPPYLLDILKYLHCVFLFSKNGLPDALPLPSDSLLRHGYWRTIELEYDVREACEALLLNKNVTKTEDYMAVVDTSIAQPAETVINLVSPPEKRPVVLLFVAGDIPTEFRSFEIDQELADFMATELNEPNCCKKLPPCYEDLVDLGLCHSLDRAFALAKLVEEELSKHGYMHLEEAISNELFFQVVLSLGTVVGTDQIKLNVTRRKLHSPEEIEFHTDSFLSDINAWQCEEPALEGGATVLLDTADLEVEFSPQELELLTHVEMECPNREHSQKYRKPLLMRDGERNRIFYTPWFMIAPRSLEEKKVQEKFAAYVENKKAHQAIPVILKKDECLFIDNKRMLHGRGPLPPDTKRCLKRFWIATGPFDTELME